MEEQETEGKIEIEKSFNPQKRNAFIDIFEASNEEIDEIFSSKNI